MLLLILTSVLILTTLFGWGILLEKIVKNFFFSGLSGILISGILAVSTLATVSAFFLPINIFFEIFLLLSGIASALLNWKKVKFPGLKKADLYLIISGFLIIIFAGSFYPYILDHFGYYVPTVNWLREFGFVKGISNLDLTLGQTSFWHIFQACFGNFTDPFLRINCVLIFIYLIYIFEKKRWIGLLFLPFFLLFTQSPSPDLPIIIFSLITVSEIFAADKNFTAIFALSVFAFAVKPTVLWLPVFSFLYGIFICKASAKNYIPGFFILLLMICKNLWLFGYPVFPAALFDLNLPWKPDAQMMKLSSEFAVQKTFDNQFTLQQIKNFSLFEYAKNWLFLDGIKSIMNILLCITLIAFLLFSIIKKKKIMTILCFSIFLKCAVVLLFSAQYRFFLDVFFVVFFVFFSEFFIKRKAVILNFLLTSIVLTFLLFPPLVSKIFPDFRMSSYMGTFEMKQLVKPSIYEYHQFNSFKVGNLNFNVSKNYPFNYNTPLPAISEGYLFDYQKTGVFPQMIDGDDLGKGFISKKMNSDEKSQLDRIILKIKNETKR